jgi:enoyl-CoA hydratase/carnithine racemase
VLELTVERPIAWARLDRPEKLNAMPRSFWAELREAMERLGREPDVRVVIFHGAGRGFSVGGDIEDFGAIGDVADRRAYMREAQDAYRAVERLPKPTIAAVHGVAAGGGCELTLVCDLVVADASARFSMPETGVGLVPGIGVVRGRAHLNRHWLKYLVMTGLPLSAEEARLAGLCNRVVGEGEHLAEAQRLAEVLAARSPLALAVGKSVLDRDADEGWAHAAEAVALLQGAEDFAEGIAAFTERRKPRFAGAGEAG